MSKALIYNTFVHTDLGNGHATLAIRETMAANNTGIIEVGVAFCSPNEQFNRRIGRTIASGRLNAKRRFYAIVPRNTDIKLKTQAEAMLHQLLDGENVVFESVKGFGWQANGGMFSQPDMIRETAKVQLPRWVEEAAV
jgi:hypothetical protein